MKEDRLTITHVTASINKTILNIWLQVAGSVQYQTLRPKPFQQNFLLTAQGDFWKVATDTFRHQEHSAQTY